MKKMAILLLAGMITILFLAGFGTGSGLNKSEKTEIIITEGHQFFMGADDREKLSSDTYAIRRGDKLDIGGLSDLKIRIVKATPDSVTFTTSCYLASSDNLKDCTKRFTLVCGKALKLVDMGIDDAASWYLFEIKDGSGTASPIESEDLTDRNAEYSIKIVSGEDMIVSCPEYAAAGETVHLETFMVTDAVLRIKVNGQELGEFISECDYEFVMPEEDVEIKVKIDTDGFYV